MSDEWMASRVKEVLPQVPLDTIERDLLVTGNIDETIIRLLDGVLSFTEEPIPNPSSTLSTPSTTTTTTPTVSNTTTSFNTAAQSFPSSPYERMKSFKQRKDDLIKAARQRYIQKHGLKL